MRLLPPLLLAAILSASVRAEDSVPFYVCYSQIQVTGTLDVVDQALDKIAKVLAIQNRMHTVTRERTVRVTAMASVTGFDREDVKSRVSPESVKLYLSLTKQSLNDVSVAFIGCAQMVLNR
jgi:hypothetical protein